MNIYTIADNIISPLGSDTLQNFRALLRSESGIRLIESQSLSPTPLHAACLDQQQVTARFEEHLQQRYTRLEKSMILSIEAVLGRVPDLNKERLVLVISSTKGNIDLLGKEGSDSIGAERVGLPAMAHAINSYFRFPNEAVVVSNACISGVSALLVAKKLIGSGLYDHALVVGGDLLDEFIISGFQCLMAISDEVCRPYDAARKGINLGEATGTLLISRDANLCQDHDSLSLLAGGGQSNDANHISGPSRTGKGLKIAINSALRAAGIPKEDLGYISAHGTATLFNDEMEAIAFHDLELSHLPLNSLKGYFGHTLGAAGVVESIIAIRQLNAGVLFKSPGYSHSGVSRELHVLQENKRVKDLKAVLKTVSGFGGCNAAVIFSKA